MQNTSSLAAASELMTQLISGKVDETDARQIFLELVSLPISSALLAAGAEVLISKMVPVPLDSHCIDTCGTGGSAKQTINTSTLTALIVAACGGKVAKHGNRSASGNCGCFDLLELLDVKIDLTPDLEKAVFDEMGIVFLFAPLHHPALRHVAALRKEYSKRTLFNLIGPLCNPSGVQRQMIGTGNKEQARIIADALYALGRFGSTVVCGDDGLDEVTTTTETTIFDVTDAGIEESHFSPKDIGVPVVISTEIEGGIPEKNVQVFLDLLRGNGDEAKRNLALVNAAHALMLTGIPADLHEAFSMTKVALDSGKAHDIFEQYKKVTNQYS